VSAGNNRRVSIINPFFVAVITPANHASFSGSIQLGGAVFPIRKQFSADKINLVPTLAENLFDLDKPILVYFFLVIMPLKISPSARFDSAV
jgi:hypothetical protein